MGRRAVLAAASSLLVAVASVVVFSPPAFAVRSSTWNAFSWNKAGGNIGQHTTASSTTPTSAHFTFGSSTTSWAALLTSQKTLTGDLGLGTGVTATVTVTAPGATFTARATGGCGTAPSVRLYFAAAGSSTSTGFSTQVWWSNPVAVPLATGTFTLTTTLTPTSWSDYNGQFGNQTATVNAAFDNAVTKVKSIGLSFGGGCFFENGVASSAGGSFTLTHFGD